MTTPRWIDGVRQDDVSPRGAVQLVNGLMVSGSLFDVLGVPARVGRTFTAADDRRGCAPAAMLSHGYWQRRHGGDPGVVGLLYGVEPGDTGTLGLAIATLTAVVIAAGLLPARRAARLDPVAALRED